MGRKSLETVLGMDPWPYPKPVFVLSNTLSALPAKIMGKAEIVNGGLKDILRYLHDRGFKNLYIDGGQTIQSFLREDLIDEMIITRVPILLGSGVPLFGKNDLELQFEHLSTEVLNNMLVRSRYLRKR